jgi:predicted RNA-binding protein associated with RNAse of E/G family
MTRVYFDPSDLFEEKKVYIFKTNENEDYFRDCVFSRIILDFHNENVIDTLFHETNSNYPILEGYCNHNSKFPIVIKTHERDNVTDYFLDVYEYSQNEPSKMHIGCLLDGPVDYCEENVAKIYDLFDSAKFNVEFIIA